MASSQCTHRKTATWQFGACALARLTSLNNPATTRRDRHFDGRWADIQPDSGLHCSRVFPRNTDHLLKNSLTPHHQKMSWVTAFPLWQFSGRFRDGTAVPPESSSCNGAPVSGLRGWSTNSISTRWIDGFKFTLSRSCWLLWSACCWTEHHPTPSHRSRTWTSLATELSC